MAADAATLRAVCQRLEGVWEGSSISRVSEATKWQDTILRFQVLEGAEAEEARRRAGEGGEGKDDGHDGEAAGAPAVVLKGRGTSVWRGRRIPFSVDGVVRTDSVPWRARLVKQHEGEYSNTIDYTVDLLLGAAAPSPAHAHARAALSAREAGDGLVGAAAATAGAADAAEAAGPGGAAAPAGAAAAHADSLLASLTVPLMRGTYMNGSIQLHRVADWLSGMWVGESVSEKGEMTTWTDTQLTFEFEGPSTTMGRLEGAGVSRWRDLNISFDCWGTFNWSTKEVKLVKQHKGSFTNRIKYSAALLPHARAMSGQYKSGIIELRREHDVQPYAPLWDAGSLGASARAGDPGGGASAVAGAEAPFAEAESKANPGDLVRSPDPTPGGKVGDDASGTAAPHTIPSVSLEVAQAIADALTGMWVGTSTDRSGTRTEWRRTRMSVSVDTGTCTGIISGSGVSLWNGASINFTLSGSVDFHRLRVQLSKQHTGTYKNRVECRCALAADLEAAGVSGDGADGLAGLRSALLLSASTGGGHVLDVVAALEALSQGMCLHGTSDRESNRVILRRTGSLGSVNRAGVSGSALRTVSGGAGGSGSGDGALDIVHAAATLAAAAGGAFTAGGGDDAGVSGGGKLEEDSTDTTRGARATGVDGARDGGASDASAASEPVPSSSSAARLVAMSQYRAFLAGLLLASNGRLGPQQRAAIIAWRRHGAIDDAQHTTALGELGFTPADLLGTVEPLKSTRDEDEGLCRICFAEDINAALIPCGHLAICMTCARRLKDKLCPICRGPFSRVQEIFRA